MRKGGLGITNPCHIAAEEYAASTKVTAPLLEQIKSQMHELPDDTNIQTLKRIATNEKNDAANEKAEVLICSALQKVKRMLDFASEKEASV